MAYQVLARKWRPKQFQDVIGQAPITRSLQNILQQGLIGHAYILAGTRGVGKNDSRSNFRQGPSLSAAPLRWQSLRRMFNLLGV